MQAIPYWRLSGFYFSYFALMGAFVPYWSLYLQSISFTAFQIGVLTALLHVMRVFAPAVWGWLSDHTGKRLAIVQAAMAAGLLSYCGVVLDTSFGWLFVIMALMSFFWSASLPLMEATTLSYLREGIATYGRIRVWGSVGFICSVAGMGYMLDTFNIESLLWALLGFNERAVGRAEVLEYGAAAGNLDLAMRARNRGMFELKAFLSVKFLNALGWRPFLRPAC
jgi:PPP family 3-phenylpropionic acid transporter